ncbi:MULTISPECIES: molybdenum cofactor guanylyltransferase MobA [unclassified Staphylococcus]|uniref:molybdenum cofactor guanylyltransferase MobA n=1 Tax=unclassified Staphylococcus TaxID=91994 RepID=UPI0021D0A3FE|nr:MULTISPECIES: molybdenum cofactor guanylyltransferase MobA [unclassified Staphylococcus]UXR78004.1 molybdenum cofactor guanylyltransferase MobA [Staphylococcus sp. IVB6227]UXR82165.1 molybdenum cofactor guanylyltransferase MobA [Staphylococcus sp. IVB6214]
MKAIILAGGQSTRFGNPKAFATIQGELFYQRLVQTLQSTNMFSEIIISSNTQLAGQFEDVRVVIDQEAQKDKGPLAGIYSVMQQDEDDLYFVISVDTPLVSQKAISCLYQFMVANLIESQLDIAGFASEGYPIPTIAFYHRRVEPIIEDVLQSDDLSMKHVYEQVSSKWLDVSEIDSPKYWYYNVNYPSDLEKLEEVLAE